MSHELRTPLNAIVGFTEQLRNSELPEQDATKVAIISKAADHLTRITNEILDFSKLAARAVQLEKIPFNVGEEVDFVVSTLQQLADDNQNRIETKIDSEIPPVLLGDPMRVRQILINLVGNALKFTEKGTVTISVKSDLQSNESASLLLKVSDTGIGISEENIARIFDEFEQAETSVARKFGGTGLGLSITRMLIDRMEGTIGVKSTIGEGTVFEITLPFEIGNEEINRQTTKPVKRTSLKFLKGKSVLVVDDEAYNRKLLKAHLEKTGVKISEAGNGQEALEAIERHNYDLVLLDLRMPVMDGFETLKAIRRLKSTMNSVPVIALTAAISEEEKLKMAKDSWNGVLLKPFKENEFRKIVGKVMEEEHEEAEEPVQKDVSPSFNLRSLREISGSDMVFYLDMLQTLYRTTQEGKDQINDAAEQKNWLAAAEAAHKIAAPIRHMEALEAYEELKQIESAGRSTSVDNEIISRIESVDKMLSEILIFIDTEIKNTQSTGSK